MPDVQYETLVEEAANSLLTDGTIDLETMAVADSLGFSIQALTKDAERLNSLRAFAA